MKTKKERIIFIFSVTMNFIFIIFTMLLLDNNKTLKLNLKNTSTMQNVEKGSASSSPNKMELTKEKRQKNILLYSDSMINPIDQIYLPIISNETYIKALQERYDEIWEKEYQKVMNIIEKKCVYKPEKEIWNNFKMGTEQYIQIATDFFRMEMLNNYSSNPDLHERNLGGTGTSSKLLEVKGKLYRNACMLVIPRLQYDDEYEFPKTLLLPIEDKDVKFSTDHYYDKVITNFKE